MADSTVPQDQMPPPKMAPQFTDDIAISGKGQIDSTPPVFGGPSPALAVTGKGKAVETGVPLNQTK